jgi:hypothetical protein
MQKSAFLKLSSPRHVPLPQIEAMASYAVKDRFAVVTGGGSGQ